MSGPIRAMWGRPTDDSWGQLLPVILASTCLVSIFTFFISFAAVTPETVLLVGPRPDWHALHDIAGIVAFVMHSGILLGAALFMTRRWRLPFGVMTMMFAVNSLLMVWMRIEHTQGVSLRHQRRCSRSAWGLPPQRIEDRRHQAPAARCFLDSLRL